MRRIPLLFLLTVLLLSSCSRSEPRIVYGFIELVYYHNMGRIEERYTFFVLSEDDDGIENLSELFLFHDREGLRWSFTPEDWITYNDDGRTWIGSRAVAMPENAPLPRGQYRAVLLNRGGERTVRNFTFDGPETPPHPFPTFTISDGLFTISSLYPVNHFIGFNDLGESVAVKTLESDSGHIFDLEFPANVLFVALWAENPDFLISALTEAASIW